jgi:hypothetical protein
MDGFLNASNSSPNRQKPSDIFEEFEFKPITSGLGFQNRKKSNPNSESLSFENFNEPISSVKSESQTTILDGKEPAPKINLPFKGALRGELDLIEGQKGSEQLQPRVRESSLKKQPEVAQSKVAEILGDLKQQRRQEAQKSKKTEEPLFKLSSPDFSALILDSMLVVALALSCLIILILVTEVDLVQIALTRSQELIFPSLLLILAMLSWSYLVLTRVFLGHTPGEWVFDQRLFLPGEEVRLTSRLKIIWRSTLVVATGWVLLPFLSLILGRDLAGSLSGARIYRKLF